MGLLITIEGGEYVGKTSLASPALKSFLSATGLDVMSSREPGGTIRAEQMRQEIFKKLREGAPMQSIAELIYEARKIHLDEVIIPYLGQNKEKNKIMILDRYLDSSRVYQGLEGGLSMESIQKLDEQYVQGYLPDITYILYFPEKKFDEIFQLRKNYVLHHEALNSNRDITVYDQIDLAKHKRRQLYYMELPKIAIERNENRVFEYIDASQHPYDVIKDIITHCASYMVRTNHIETPYKTIADFLQIFERLKSDGVWDELDHIWQEQHPELH